MIKIKIKKNKDKKSKAKFPCRIYLDNGRIIPVPSQHHFKSSFIRNHGCSLVGFYIALRFLGIKKDMTWCKSYMNKHYKLNGCAKFNLEKISKAINKIASGSPATFKKSPSADVIKKALQRGDMVLFEERDPIHTAVLLQKGKDVLRFSDGRYKKATVDQEVKKRCGDSYYGGCVIIRNTAKI